MVWSGALGGWVTWVIAIRTEVVMKGEWVAASWLVLVVIPGVGEPMNLAHGG